MRKPVPSVVAILSVVVALSIAATPVLAADRYELVLAGITQSRGPLRPTLVRHGRPNSSTEARISRKQQQKNGNVCHGGAQHRAPSCRA